MKILDSSLNITFIHLSTRSDCFSLTHFNLNFFFLNISAGFCLSFHSVLLTVLSQTLTNLFCCTYSIFSRKHWLICFAVHILFSLANIDSFVLLYIFYFLSQTLTNLFCCTYSIFSRKHWLICFAVHILFSLANIDSFVLLYIFYFLSQTLTNLFCYRYSIFSRKHWLICFAVHILFSLANID